jgi:hypothetical protein
MINLDRTAHKLYSHHCLINSGLKAATGFKDSGVRRRVKLLWYSCGDEMAERAITETKHRYWVTKTKTFAL